MNTIVSKLNAIKEHYQLTDRQFAIKINVLPQTLGNQLKERRAVSLETFVAIAQNFPDISAEWLLRGDGEMLRKESKDIAVNVNSLGSVTGKSIVNMAAGGSTITTSATDDKIIKENARLREEVRTLRIRCDKLTDLMLEKQP